MVCIARDPGVRLRDIGTALDITERTAHTIVSELIEVGYVVKEKRGRRNRYEIQEQSALRDTAGHTQTIGEILEILIKASPPADPDDPRSQLRS